MARKKIYCVQAARGMAALMVVAFHMLPIEAKYVAPHVLPSIFRFGQVGVDVFFVISGFVMTMTTGYDQENARSSLVFLYRRVSRIYPIYWFYLLLLVPVFIVAPQMINASEGNQVDLIRSFLLIPDEHLPLLAVGWSLIFEMWFYIVFAVVLLTQRRFLPLLMIIWATAILAANTGAPWASPIARTVSSPYCLEFIAGGFAFWASRRLNAMAGAMCAAVGIVIVVGALAFNDDLLASVDLARTLSIGIGTAMGLAGAVALEAAGRLRTVRRLKWCGDISYSIYLSHVLVLSVLGRLWLYVADDSESMALVIAFWLACLTVVLAGGLVSYHFAERPLLMLARRSGSIWIGRNRPNPVPHGQ